MNLLKSIDITKYSSITLLTQKLHAAYVAILHLICNECSFHFIGLVCDDAISYGKEIKWFISYLRIIALFYMAHTFWHKYCRPQKASIQTQSYFITSYDV